VRLFLAAPLPDGLQSTLFLALTAARRAAAQARWVRPGQLHLTLAFFGETAAADVPSLVDALRPVGARHAPPRLGLRGAGCFGRPHAPSLLFAELDGDLQGLRLLELDVRSAVGLQRVAGGPSREAFHPHLTLARARSRQGDAALRRCQRALRHQALGTFLLERLALFQSELGSAGPAYTPLAEFPLGAAAAAHP
jgi:2'-5' RNA ligase